MPGEECTIWSFVLRNIWGKAFVRFFLCNICIFRYIALSFGYLTAVQYAENNPTQNATQKGEKGTKIPS